MLIYHFGTRDALLRAVLRRARERHVEAFSQLLRPRPDEPYPATLARAWHDMTGPRGRPYLRLFGQLRESSEQRLWPDFRRTATTDWLAPLENGMASMGRPELATLVLAVIRGLLMGLDATGDTARVDRAFADFLRTIQDHRHHITVKRRAAGRPGGQPFSLRPAWISLRRRSCDHHRPAGVDAARSRSGIAPAGASWTGSEAAAATAQPSSA